MSAGVDVAIGARDAFAWWAEIIIPSALGLATVLVSVVAVHVSRRASALARQVEAQRHEAELERARDAERSRLREMAIDEARALHRWVVEALRPQFGVVTRPVNSPQPPRSPRDQAQVDATVALEQSLVPGAQALLDITRIDIEGIDEHIVGYGGMGAVRHREYDRIRSARVERTFRRIRGWALAPAASAPHIQRDLHAAEDDRTSYLLFGESVDDLYAGG